MKNSLFVAGLSSLVVAAVFYAIGYTNHTYMVGSVKVLVFPAAFFALLSLVLLSGGVRASLKSGKN